MMDISKMSELHRTVLLALSILLMVGIGYGLAQLKSQLQYSQGVIDGFQCGSKLPTFIVPHGSLTSITYVASVDSVKIRVEYGNYTRILDSRTCQRELLDERVI